jgi:hypothetical protein
LPRLQALEGTIAALEAKLDTWFKSEVQELWEF